MDEIFISFSSVTAIGHYLSSPYGINITISKICPHKYHKPNFLGCSNRLTCTLTWGALASV